MSEQIVTQAHLTIVDNNDIESIIVEYARNQSTSEAPASGWSTTRPAWAQGYYIWQRTRIHKSGTQDSADTFGTAVCLTGSTGQTGQTGATGQSLSSTKTQYTNVASNVTITTSNHTNYTWTDNVPAYDSSKPIYWGRITNIYVNPAKTEYLVYKDQGTTDAITTAAAANSTANTANQTANTANQTANQANQTANQANQTATNAYNIATGINQHFWTIATDYATGLPAGSYITDTAIDTFKSQKTGGNLLTRSDGIWLRNGIKTLASLTGTSLIFYNPSSNAKGMELDSSALKFYDATGGVAQATFGGTQAIISGTINVYDGKIGNNANNYWYIGNYTDYNQNYSAIIKSKGTASIQLNETDTWRISTNRIHTAWAPETGTDAFKLHFPKFNDSQAVNKFWDYGLHLPTSYNDKFLYIRNASGSETLDNLLNDLDDGGYDYWKYRFYISADGSLYAKNLYVLDDDGNTTQIGGTDGVYLLKSGGTITGNLEVNGALTKGGKTVTYLTSTPTNGQILVADGTSGSIKTSGYTIATSVPSGAIFTDKNVQTSQANTTKIYLAGTSTTGTTTGTLNFDSNVYLTTTAGTLHATTFEGNLSGTATKANQDGDGNVIKTTYLKLSGGNVTGPVSFGDSVSIDDLTAGNLIVNGAGRFTNGLYGDLTGNADTATTATTATKVEKDLKIQLNGGTTEGTNQFTFNGSAAKTVNITKSGIGLGNVENKSSATIRGELTSANVTTALGFTPYNSTNPNGYTTNTGTVTSVAASGSGGITISGSPITTSGTITVGLNLSTAINGLGEGTSNANRNDYIVAQYAAGGTTTTTYHRRSLAHIFAALNSSDITTALGYTPYDATNPDGYTTNTGTVTSVKVQGSNGLTGSGTVTTTGTITLSHADTSSQASSSNSGRTYIQSITLDSYGHVTGLSTATETVTNTHNTAYLYAGASNGTANAATTNGNTYLILMDGGSATTRRKVSGSGTVSVASDASGNITITGSAHPTSLKNPNALTIKIYNGSSTSSDTSYDGSTANQSVSVAGTNAITGINSTTDGKLQLTLADGSQPDPISVKITATTSDSAASADKLNLSANVGSLTQPVYFNANTGLPAAINYTIQSNVPQNAKFTDTWTAMVGATSSANGSVGYVNAVPPKDGYNTKFLRADGTWVVPGGTYSLPLAANGTRGGVQIGYTTNDKNYAVQLSSEKMYVNVPWTDTTYTVATGDSNGQIKVTPSSGNAYNVGVKGLGTAAFANTTLFPIVSTYILAAGKAVRIQYPTHVPVLISAQRSNTGGRLILLGGGYGPQGTVRNDFQEVVSSGVDSFTWTLPSSSSISNSIEIMNVRTSEGATITVWSSSAVTFTEIDSLSDTAMNKRIIDSTNYTNYTVTKTGTGASGTWGISISGNATTATSATKANITTIANSVAKYSDTSGTFTDSYITIDSSGNLIIGDNDHPANIKIGAKNDNYGLMPNVNNYNQIGANGLAWYRAYVTNYYGTHSYITHWRSGNNIGTPATSSADSLKGFVYFINECVAGGTQTKTTLQADSTTASNITVTLPKETGTLALTKNYQPYVHYSNSIADNNGKYYKISINSYTSWMLSFNIRLYHSYKAYDLQISGYNYGSNHWYSPSAKILGASVLDSINILFGYDSNYHLWIAIPAQSYTGIDIVNVTNGHTQVDALEGLFTIEMINSEPTTIQETITAYRPWYRNETVSNATNATNATSSTYTTNLLAYAGNEVIIGANSTAKNSSTNNAVYINYRDVSDSTSSNTSTAITDYYFCNRKGVTDGVNIRANTFIGNLTGTATKAIQDGDDNTIASTYLKLSGGTMTGSLKWNSASLPQFSGAPTYLVGIDGFADGGTMKWQYAGHITVGSATKAAQDKNGNDITTKYVTVDTEQTITASQKTFNGAIRWGTSSKYGAAHYDSILEAIVFSFA